MLSASDLHIETIDDLPDCADSPLIALPLELAEFVLPVILLGAAAPPVPFSGGFALESMIYVFVF